MLHRTGLAAALLLGALALLALPAPRAIAAGDTSTIQVTQIRASGKEAGPKDIAAELTDLAKALEGSPYHKFERVGKDSKTATDGKPTSFALHGGYTLSVTARAGEKGKILIDVAIKDASGAEKFSTKLKLNDGATVLIGKDLEEGDGHLYLALQAKRG